MIDPKKFVEQIRQDINDSRSARLWDDSIHMLSTVSESIFSRSAHFILEVLQNAEDAGRKGSAPRGEIAFHLSPQWVKIVHNGAPFSEADINAICGVRSSKHPELDTLGYLGIGFKSVFKVSDCPQIHSGGFHFKFDKNAVSDPANEPWQIIPHWVGDATEQTAPQLTTILLPFRNAESYEQTLIDLQKLDVHVFLFLKWLKKLTLVDEANGKRLVIEHLGEHDKIVELRKDQSAQRFIVFRRKRPVPENVANDPALEFYRRQHVAQREVVIAFGLDDSGNLQPIEEASALGSVSSFLPLLEERTGAKFLIQSDFLVQPGREAIQYELSWNQWLVRQAAELAKEAIEEFKQHTQWKFQFLPVFKFQQYRGQAAFDKLFYPMLQQPVIEHLSQTAVYPTVAGGHVKPEQAVAGESTMIELVGDADLPTLFPGKLELQLADPNVDQKLVPPEVQSRVQVLGWGMIARNKQLLESKLNEPSHVQWFVKLYDAMTQTDQYFRTVTYRSQKGNYSSVEAPIYVLTDTEEIVPATQALLPEVSAEVLELRKQFPAVNSLLSSFHLVHPALLTPELIQFFKERTHVHVFDYSKVCRDVFLPSLSVGIDKTPPSKNELVAHSRLLQKGPSVQGRIWVLTKSGATSPSDQVFFGTGYSPSEDWETNKTYAPHIDFISEDYLAGPNHPEVGAWKAFFRQFGVKEAGQNVDVELFAKAFARERLAPELNHFVDKDRKQYGYDLEGVRKTDNAPVKLEIKGQKKEGPVELNGNEPEAAQQARLKAEPFWMCVVPGIPETPILWVVENVMSAGSFHILTVDVSKWKSQGRRVS